MSGTRRSDSQDLTSQFNNSSVSSSWYPAQPCYREYEYDYHPYTNVDHTQSAHLSEVTWQGIGHDVSPMTSRKRRLSSSCEGGDQRRPSPSMASYESTSAGTPSASSSTFETLMDIQNIGGGFGDAGNLFNTYDIPPQDEATMYWQPQAEDLMASNDYSGAPSTEYTGGAGPVEYEEYASYAGLIADHPSNRPSTSSAAVATGRPLSRDPSSSCGSGGDTYTMIKPKEEEGKGDSSIPVSPSGQSTAPSSPGGRSRKSAASDASSDSARDYNTRPALTEANLEKLNDISEFRSNPKYANLIVDYSPKISFPLGEGGRELLRACLNVKGCKGRQLQGASVPQLLELANNWGLWNVAIRIKVERTTAELCPFHEKFVKFKANQSQQRKYVKKEYMVLQRGADGKIVKIVYDKDRKITLGKEGREQLRAQLRRLHDQIPGEMDALLQKHGFKYSELRNATVQQLSQMAFVCQLWHQVVHACRKQEEKRDGKKDPSVAATTSSTDGFPPLPDTLDGGASSLSSSHQTTADHLLQHHGHPQQIEQLTSSDLLSAPSQIDQEQHTIPDAYFARPSDDTVVCSLDPPCIKREPCDEPTLSAVEPNINEDPFPSAEHGGYYQEGFQDAFHSFISKIPQGGEQHMDDVFEQFLSTSELFHNDPGVEPC